MKSSPVCRTIHINGKQHYLWRAVDQDGEVVGVYLQAIRDGARAGNEAIYIYGAGSGFLEAHAAVTNIFNHGRHLVRAEHYRNLRVSACADWSRAVA